MTQKQQLKQQSETKHLAQPEAAPSLSLAAYDELLHDLKTRIRSAQVRATSLVNRELISLYREIGRVVAERQEQAGWGDSVVAQIARDLRQEFPGMTGLSRTNIFEMKRFYGLYKGESELVQQLVGQIPWGHNLLLMARVKDAAQRAWYAGQIVENGWSRAVLEHQIESGLYERQIEAPKSSNFERALPSPQSDLARQMLKDTYIFDFLSLSKEAQERDLERALIEKIREFLLELGMGFAFMGSQYHLEVGGQDFYVDLLFYHHRLRCLVAIDLKIEEFKPEFAGKMNFYLAALDDLVRHSDDAPTIGIILCKSKNQTIVEYALRDTAKPIGVASYRLTTQLPSALEQALPDAQEWQRILHAPTESE